MLKDKSRNVKAIARKNLKQFVIFKTSYYLKTKFETQICLKIPKISILKIFKTSIKENFSIRYFDKRYLFYML